MPDTESIVESIELVPIHEVAMGCESYGIRIKTKNGDFDNFSNLPVIVGHDDPARCTEESSCGKYYRVSGAFTTWILDLQNQSICVYKTTIRTPEYEWSEEQAIYGKDRLHISTFTRHYYLQFPFVGKTEFEEFYNKYVSMRIKQITQAANAL